MDEEIDDNAEDRLMLLIGRQQDRIEEIINFQQQLLAMVVANTTIAGALVKVDGGTDKLIAELASQTLRAEALLLNLPAGDLLLEPYREFLRSGLPPAVFQRIQGHQHWSAPPKTGE